MERRILFWNHVAERITGYKAEEIVEKCCQNSGLNHIDNEVRPLCALGCPLFSTLADGIQRQDQVLVRLRAGYRVPIRVNIFPIRDDEEFVGFYAISSPFEIQIIAKRCRSLVENTEVVKNGSTVHATVSVGATVVRADDTVQTLIERADRLMCESKNSEKTESHVDNFPALRNHNVISSQKSVAITLFVFITPFAFKTKRAPYVNCVRRSQLTQETGAICIFLLVK